MDDLIPLALSETFPTNQYIPSWPDVLHQSKALMRGLLPCRDLCLVVKLFYRAKKDIYLFSMA
jgi:hypothetical protein